ncbi:hypothetical protein F5X97DRAFT_164026 [Nemania serpens]|nr:hypothetical protein F5X97DRAFT_164026 [Nemania serpens]
MCRGSKVEMNCGHVDTHFRALCGKKCSSPQGLTTYLDRPCARCDPENTKKKLERITELMAQLRPQESVDRVRQLADAGRELSQNMRRGIAEARYLAYGTTDSDHTPSAHRDETAGRSWGGRGGKWEDSDSGSDSGRRDTTRLSEDMKHVTEKKYKLIDGHLSLISYRRELDEVDPDLLLKLKDKREKEFAKEKRKADRRAKVVAGDTKTAGKQAEQGGAPKDGVKRGSRKQRYEAPVTPPPSASNIPQATSNHRNPWPRHVASAKEAHSRMQEAFASVPHSSNSFRARAQRDGFLAPPFEEHHSGSEQAESSATAAGRTLKRSRAHTWVEKPDDTTYDDDADVSDSDSADSCVTVYGGPGLQSTQGKGRSASHGKSPGVEDEEEEDDDDDLDVWQIIADESEDDEGGAPLRGRARCSRK